MAAAGLRSVCDHAGDRGENQVFGVLVCARRNPESLKQRRVRF